MQKTLIFLLLMLALIPVEAQNISSGLYFAAHTSIKEERTSLILSPEFDASKGLTLDFDIKFRPEEHNYGYVFRIIIDDEKSFDLIANITPEKRALNLIEGNNVYLAFDEELLNQYSWNKWAHIQCSIYPDSLQLIFDNQTLQGQYKFINIKNVKFYFGYSDHEKFHSSDVPPMSIRNIKITDNKNKTIAYWPLKEHLSHSCLDSLYQIPATVTNPTWEINKHTKWVKEKTLYSVNNKKGISNVTLRELLWFDKTDESAQNNRRVNIRKLKLLLEKLDGVELVKESTYWALKFTHAYCDYIDVCNWIDKVKNKEPITAENINDLPLNLLSGQLLPYVQTDWLDSFKSDYTNSVLDMAINLSKQEYIKGNNELLIQIANSMFAHDKTDEYALILKCNTLYKQGRTSLAKTTFDTFCNEYKAMLNTNYTKTFNEIINCQL